MNPKFNSNLFYKKSIKYLRKKPKKMIIIIKEKGIIMK